MEDMGDMDLRYLETQFPVQPVSQCSLHIWGWDGVSHGPLGGEALPMRLRQAHRQHPFSHFEAVQQLMYVACHENGTKVVLLP